MYSLQMKQLEGLLFANADAITLKKLATLMSITAMDVKAIADALNDYYTASCSALQVIEVNQSIQLATRSDLAPLIEPLFATDKNKGLSMSSLEVLSIIAYKQPITKVEVEHIRGVKCDRPMQQLQEFGLIQIVGRLERIGKPNLFGTTELFLKKFGLKTLRDLPPIEAFDRLQMIGDVEDQGNESER